MQDVALGQLEIAGAHHDFGMNADFLKESFVDGVVGLVKGHDRQGIAAHLFDGDGGLLRQLGGGAHDGVELLGPQGDHLIDGRIRRLF